MMMIVKEDVERTLKCHDQDVVDRHWKLEGLSKWFRGSRTVELSEDAAQRASTAR